MISRWMLRASASLLCAITLIAVGACKPDNPEKMSKKVAAKAVAADDAPAGKVDPLAPGGAVKVGDKEIYLNPPITGVIVADASESAKPVKEEKPASKPDPLDWPMWRGPFQNGLSVETGIVGEWDTEGKNVVWQNKELATRSTPIVMRGKLYTLARYMPETPQEGECVVCADPATGKVLWRNHWNVFLSDVPKERVAWSCVVGDPDSGHVYAQSVNGYLQCIDGETGKTVWSHSMTEEYGLLSTYGGRTNVPIVFGDLVIASAVMTNWGELAVPTHRFLAFDKRTGKTVWFTGTTPRPADTTYSTPVTSAFDGIAAMVFGSGDGMIWAMEPRTGKPLWKYKMTLRGMNLTPLVDDGIVYMGQSEENPDANTQGQVVAIKGNAATDGKDITESGALWADKGVMIGRSSMIKLGDRLYGADDSGNMYTFEAATGKQLGRRVKLAGSIMRASLTHADGKIYACTTNVWHICVPDDKAGVKIVHRQRLPEGEEIHGSPIVSHGKLYLATTERMFCLAEKDAKAGTLPEKEWPQLAQEAKLTDTEPAIAQVVPAESIVSGGEKVKYSVRLYNAAGQLLQSDEKPKFKVEGPGQISDDGTYTAESSPVHAGVTIKAEVGSLAGAARLRVVPSLPWKWDFSDKEIPATWIGIRYRHVIREIDGNPMMVKITTIPLGTKSRGWFGPADLHDYTITADVRSAIDDNKMADAGLIAQRYTMDLMGTKQQLQLRSWDSELGRWSKTVEFKWKPDTWYTMKLQASTDGGKAVLRGKVWPRDESEPAEWTIEATDDAGNLQGSPGMFGNATDAELFIDNVKVDKN